MLGHDKNLGHADFYPNGGEQVQPGCDSLLNDYFGACSHDKSFKFFVVSIFNPNKYMANKCPSWKDFKRKRCSEEIIPMGDATPLNARGQYYLRTGGLNRNYVDDDNDESMDMAYGYD